MPHPQRPCPLPFGRCGHPLFPHRSCRPYPSSSAFTLFLASSRPQTLLPCAFSFNCLLLPSQLHHIGGLLSGTTGRAAQQVSMYISRDIHPSCPNRRLKATIVPVNVSLAAAPLGSGIWRINPGLSWGKGELASVHNPCFLVPSSPTPSALHPPASPPASPAASPSLPATCTHFDVVSALLLPAQHLSFPSFSPTSS